MQEASSDLTIMNLSSRRKNTILVLKDSFVTLYGIGIRMLSGENERMISHTALLYHARGQVL